MVKIIDYKAGNAPSVLRAVSYLKHEAAFAARPQDLEDATHIILPGVGSAGATMESLREMNLTGALEKAVFREKIPFLGICVGMQILFDHSEEGDADCLGWLKGRVVKFNASKVRVPQMGWNRVSFLTDLKAPGQETDGFHMKNAPLKKQNGFFYFVNSYYAVPDNPSDLWGVADYNGEFAAAVRKDNIYAVQFHAEKSGEAGLGLLKEFLCLQNG